MTTLDRELVRDGGDMHFTLSAEQQELQAVARRFATEDGSSSPVHTGL